MRSKKLINILNLSGFIFLTYTSKILSTKEIEVTFMPDSYSFSTPYSFNIWLIVYLCIIIWIIKGFLASPKDSTLYKSIGIWFMISMIFIGISSIVPSQLSSIFIISSLILSLITYSIANKIINNNYISKLYKVPFSMLSGWLSVVSITNICLLLNKFDIISTMGLNEIGSTIIMVITGTIIAMLFSFTENDIIFPIMFIYSYIGIIIKNYSIPKVINVSLVMCIVLLITISYTLYIRKTIKANNSLLHINIKKT